MSKFMADLIAIAEAVVEAMNTGDFSIEIHPERLYLPTFKLEEMDTLKMPVVPVTRTSTRVTREHTQRDFEIHIGIMKRFTKLSNEGIDPLMLLVDDIQTFFEKEAQQNLTLADGREATIMGFLNDDSDPAYSSDHMKEFRQFTSVLRMSVRLP